MHESGVDFPDRRRTAWLAAGVAATIVAFIFAGQSYLYQRILGHAAPVRQMIEMELVRWYLWLAFVPLIAAMIRRLEHTATGVRRRLAMHICSALGFVLAHAVITTLSSRAIEGTGAPPDLSFPAHVATMSAVDVLVYAMIVAFFYAAAYHERFRQRELFASQLQSQVAQLRLRELRMRLQPHFLFNTLNTISALMHTDVDQADAMLTAFSDLLRSSLRASERQEIPLRQEIAFVRRYLEIMGLRFGGRLTANLHIDPATVDALVPNLLLQPLVENALRHGIARCGQGGCVEIRACRLNGDLQLRVLDDGPGLPAEWQERHSTGLGLRMTRERLDTLYGPRHHMEIGNREEGGAQLLLTIPFRVALQTRPAA